jgi:hypothetical protein
MAKNAKNNKIIWQKWAKNGKKRKKVCRKKSKNSHTLY